MEFKAEGANLRLIDGGQRHDRRVAAAFEFQSKGDQRIGIAIGADIRENDAQVESSGFVLVPSMRVMHPAETGVTALP